MKRTLGIFLAMALLWAIPALSQQHEGERQAEPHALPHPTPERRPPAPPEPRRDAHADRENEPSDHGHPNPKPHVKDNHWYGHDSPGDPRYHLAHPFQHGHFAQVGPSYHFTVVRVDTHHHRFWFPGGYFFEVAAWDWDECAGWCWTCADEFVIYDDPDHDGWCLLYDLTTGEYVHVIFLGT